MPVTNAFLSSKLVSKLACGEREERTEWMGHIEKVWTIGRDGGRRRWCVCLCVWVGAYLVHDRGGRGFDAWLLVREGQLLQQVHVGQGILQGHVGRHGNKASLTQHPSLAGTEKEANRGHEMRWDEGAVDATSHNDKMQSGTWYASQGTGSPGGGWIYSCQGLPGELAKYLWNIEMWTGSVNIHILSDNNWI